MQPWQASLLACFMGMLGGAFSAYVGIRILQTRHDEKIRFLEGEQRRFNKNIHDLREDVRATLIRYLEDRIQDSKERHVVRTLSKRFRRPAPKDDADEASDDES